MEMIWVRKYQWSPVHCSVPCIVEFRAVCSKLWSPPPPKKNPYISEMAFSHRFQKVYIYPGNDILAHRMRS